MKNTEIDINAKTDRGKQATNRPYMSEKNLLTRLPIKFLLRLSHSIQFITHINSKLAPKQMLLMSLNDCAAVPVPASRNHVSIEKRYLCVVSNVKLIKPVSKSFKMFRNKEANTGDAASLCCNSDEDKGEKQYDSCCCR